MGLWVECSSMGLETGVQSQVESYQKLKKWYLIPPCLTLSIIRYLSRIKWSNPEKGVVPSPRCSSYWKGSFRLQTPTLLTSLLIYIYIYIYIYANENIYTYICIYIQMRIYIYIYICKWEKIAIDWRNLTEQIYTPEKSRTGSPLR